MKIHFALVVLFVVLLLCGCDPRGQFVGHYNATGTKTYIFSGIKNASPENLTGSPPLVDALNMPVDIEIDPNTPEGLIYSDGLSEQPVAYTVEGSIVRYTFEPSFSYSTQSQGRCLQTITNAVGDGNSTSLVYTADQTASNCPSDINPADETGEIQVSLTLTPR